MQTQARLTKILLGVGASLYLTKRYFNGGKCTNHRDLQGQTVLITGGNRGIGKETALDLAKRGARVVIASRSYDTLDVVKEIVKKSGNQKVEFAQLDLNDFQSIRNFAEKFNCENHRLDILINNAGVYNTRFSKTKEGFESNFGINHLGHFLLTNLLLQKIVNTPQSRIVIVSSRAHTRPKTIDFESLNQPTNGLMKELNLYPQSKLANSLFATELVDRLKGTDTKVVSLHPGVIKTGIYQHNFSQLPFGRLIGVLLYPISLLCFKNEYYGAQTTLTCCYEDFNKLVNGGYYKDNNLYKSSPVSQDKELANKLWDYSVKAVNLDKIRLY
ncbi:hypothetical protein ABPG74_017515 [Tetrahymena malaccensis]